MPFSRSDYDRITALIKGKKIDEAKRILREIKDPRAQVMLDRLLEKYPDSAPARASGDPLTEVKSLIAQKRYNEAEELLWGIDNPEADVLLRKLKLVQGTQTPATKSTGVSPEIAPVSGFQLKAKEKPPSKSNPLRTVLIIAVVGLLVVCGALFYNMQQVSQAAAREIGMQFDMQEVCYEVYRDDFSHIDSDSFYDACKEEAESIIIFYRATVERCYKEWEDETYKEIVCLADGGAEFSGTYIMIADAKSR
jgi:hypothetical protein